MPKLSITYSHNEAFRVGSEFDWEFSINGFNGVDSGWEVSGDGSSWTPIELGRGAIFVPHGFDGCFLRAYLVTLEPDRSGQEILCRYTSAAYGPIGEAL